MANTPTTIADMFAAEEKVTVKYSEFYRIIENACSQAAALMYIKNAVMAGVPNAYIQSMLDGQKHWDELKGVEGELTAMNLPTIQWVGSPMYGKLEDMEDNDGKS